MHFTYGSAWGRLLASVTAVFLLLGFAACEAAVVGVAKAPADVDIDAAVMRAVELAGGLPDKVGPGAKIVIQPNLVQAGVPSGSGAITDARVVRAIVGMCLQRGAYVDDIAICEGSASFWGDRGNYTDRQMTLKAFYDSGLDRNKDMREDVYGVKLMDANDAGGLYPNYPTYTGPYNNYYVTRIIKPFLINRAYYLPNIIAQCDVLIRVPVFKTHNLAGITGALKLSFGHAPSDIYHYHGLSMYKHALLHMSFTGDDELTTNAKGMADMTLCRPPDLVVMDGLVGVTNGPVGGADGGGGTIYPPPGGPLRIIAATTDPVANDTFETLAAGFKVDIASVPGIFYAAANGLGTFNVDNIVLRGERINDIRRWFPPWGAADPGDSTAPTLQGINVTTNNDILTVQPVGAQDNLNQLAKAELYVDGLLCGTSPQPPYGFALRMTGAGDGNHLVTYVLYDTMLNEVSRSQSVSIDAGPPIGSALGLANGQETLLGPVVFAGTSPELGRNTFFVTNSEGTSGLRVLFWGEAPNIEPGTVMRLHGRMIPDTQGQRIMQCWDFTEVGPGAAPQPKFMKNSAIGGVNLNGVTSGVVAAQGPYNLGCLVRTSGTVTIAGPDSFRITDGSRPGTVQVLCSEPAPPVGARVLVTGFACSANGQPVIAVRSGSDVEVLPEPAN